MAFWLSEYEYEVLTNPGLGRSKCGAVTFGGRADGRRLCITEINCLYIGRGEVRPGGACNTRCPTGAKQYNI